MGRGRSRGRIGVRHTRIFPNEGEGMKPDLNPKLPEASMPRIVLLPVPASELAEEGSRARRCGSSR